MSWDQKLFHWHLKTRRFGREIEHFAELDSTNRWLRDNVARFSTTGGIVVADHQTAGRGRHDRIWFDVPNESLLFSLLLKNAVAEDAILILSFLPAIALGELLSEKLAAKFRVELKWPNDVLLNGKKISGVLGQAEGTVKSRVVVLGTGVNLTGIVDHFPAEIRPHASSILAETGTTFAREVWLAELLNRMEPLYDELLEGETETMLQRWMALGPVPGTRLTRREQNLTASGRYAGLGRRGQLILRDNQGNTREWFSGDVEYDKKTHSD